MSKEVRNWPYDFPQSQAYVPPTQRGSVIGRLLVQDWYLRGGRFQFADSAYIGLALPGNAGSWQRESKVLIVIKIINLKHRLLILKLKFSILNGLTIGLSVLDPSKQKGIFCH